MFRGSIASLQSSSVVELDQQSTEPFQGSEVSHLDGTQTNPEFGRDHGEREVFEIAELKNPVVGRRQAIESGLDPLALLSLDRTSAGTRTFVREAVDEPLVDWPDEANLCGRSRVTLRLLIPR